MNRFITGALYMNITHTAYGCVGNVKTKHKIFAVCSYKTVKSIILNMWI
jgi:hypothetical protein